MEEGQEQLILQVGSDLLCVLCIPPRNSFGRPRQRREWEAQGCPGQEKTPRPLCTPTLEGSLPPKNGKAGDDPLGVQQNIPSRWEERRRTGGGGDGLFGRRPSTLSGRGLHPPQIQG